MGYATDVEEVCRAPGDRPVDELGECPDVYDMVVEGGVCAGVPVE